jgi:hypothetical protein
MCISNIAEAANDSSCFFQHAKQACKKCLFQGLHSSQKAAKNSSFFSSFSMIASLQICGTVQ